MSSSPEPIICAVPETISAARWKVKAAQSRGGESASSVMNGKPKSMKIATTPPICTIRTTPRPLLMAGKMQGW